MHILRRCHCVAGRGFPPCHHPARADPSGCPGAPGSSHRDGTASCGCGGGTASSPAGGTFATDGNPSFAGDYLRSRGLLGCRRCAVQRYRPGHDPRRRQGLPADRQHDALQLTGCAGRYSGNRWCAAMPAWRRPGSPPGSWFGRAWRTAPGPCPHPLDSRPRERAHHGGSSVRCLADRLRTVSSALATLAAGIEVPGRLIFLPAVSPRRPRRPGSGTGVPGRWWGRCRPPSPKGRN